MSDIIDALVCLEDNGLDDQMVQSVSQRLLDNDGFADNDDKKVVALIIHTNSLDVEVTKYDDCTFKADGAEYLVLDEDELAERWDNSLESLLDDCVEGADGPYFDREAWKRDARMDGAGHRLSTYDGHSYEYADLTVFRTN